MNTIQGNITAKTQGPDPKKLALLLNVGKRKAPDESFPSKIIGMIAGGAAAIFFAWLGLKAAGESDFSRPSDHIPQGQIANPAEPVSNDEDPLIVEPLSDLVPDETEPEGVWIEIPVEPLPDPDNEKPLILEEIPIEAPPKNQEPPKPEEKEQDEPAIEDFVEPAYASL